MNILHLLIAVALFLSSAVTANQATYTKAQTALANQNHILAKRMFSDILDSKDFQALANMGLAQVAFYQEQLDDAEDLIEAALATEPNNPDILYFAGRIAGKQAQQASIFTKLGYARDAKRYFSQALAIDRTHQEAIIGLIRFHQQAPVIAGGDKDAIPEFVQKLAAIDKRAAFAYQLPTLLDNKQIEQALEYYKVALAAPSRIDSNQFRFDFAMQLSYHGQYKAALQEMLSIQLPAGGKQPEFAAMRHYQIGKMAAESNTQHDVGINHMLQYANLPAAERTIDQEWINFRLAQLRYLKRRNLQIEAVDTQVFTTLLARAQDPDLKDRINTFISDKTL